jgi:hypothetical protein
VNIKRAYPFNFAFSSPTEFLCYSSAQISYSSGAHQDTFVLSNHSKIHDDILRHYIFPLQDNSSFFWWNDITETVGNQALNQVMPGSTFGNKNYNETELIRINQNIFHNINLHYQFKTKQNESDHIETTGQRRSAAIYRNRNTNTGRQ